VSGQTFPRDAYINPNLVGGFIQCHTHPARAGRHVHGKDQRQPLDRPRLSRQRTSTIDSRQRSRSKYDSSMRGWL